MKAVIVLFLSYIYLMANELESNFKYKANYSFEERVSAFKKDGIIYCLDNRYNSGTITIGYDETYYIGIYLDLFDTSELLHIIEELQSYVKKKKSEINLGNLVYVAPCLELYDSKEYQDEVERIVRKYCKDCK